MKVKDLIEFLGQIPNKESTIYFNTSTNERNYITEAREISLEIVTRSEMGKEVQIGNVLLSFRG